jgi:hypothetical protein
MQSKSEEVAAIVAELEAENAALLKHIDYLRAVMDRGLSTVMAPASGVFVPLPPPKEIAFGQRWALVFTIGPDNPHTPSLDRLFCELHQAGGKSNSYLPIYDMPFGHDELPEHAFYLGTVPPTPGDKV